MKLHVVSFQMPYPPDYGGVVDVYYKLKALKEAGCSVTLHTFCYGRDRDDRIGDVVDEVFYYRRSRGLLRQLTLRPYIVETRADPRLLENLRRDNAPVLFEGLHTCSFIKELASEGRRVYVRSHNVEHDYYRQLSSQTKSLWRRAYYAIEAWRLKRYENVMGYADMIYAISDSDVRYFSDKFGAEKVCHLPAFFDDGKSSYTGAGERYDVLYHGNLEVEENERAAEFIIKEIKPLLPSVAKVAVTGRNPSRRLVELARAGGVTLLANPTDNVLNDMIGRAAVNLLLSEQDTGIKLKLMKVLSQADGHCVINGNLAVDDRLRDYCHIAESREEIAAKVTRLLEHPMTQAEAGERRRSFLENYSAAVKIRSLLRE